jgi:hypothetical protein
MVTESLVTPLCGRLDVITRKQKYRIVQKRDKQHHCYTHKGLPQIKSKLLSSFSLNFEGSYTEEAKKVSRLIM